MCGRFSITAPAEAVLHHFDLQEVDPFPPRYNIAPTQPILVVRGGLDRPAGSNAPDREALLMRWGLVPSWARDPKDLPLLINARSETAATKPAFRGPMRHGRVLIPASGFYEWRRSGGGVSQPYWIRPRDGSLLAFGGLSSHFMASDGSEIDTAAILTTGPNGTMAPIHDRMPVIIGQPDFARWLDCRDGDAATVADLLAPAADDLLEAVPVSTAVNKVANSSPEVQEPLREDAIPSEPERPRDSERQRDLFGN